MSEDDAAQESRTKRVTFYVSESEREALKREAHEADKSLSGYVLQLIRRQRQLDAEEEISKSLNPEERLMQVARDATDMIEESAESVESVSDDVESAVDDMKDLQARSGTYPLVNFRLLMRLHKPPETWVSDQFGWAATKLRQPLNEHDPFTGLDGGDSSGSRGQSSDSSTDADESETSNLEDRI